MYDLIIIGGGPAGLTAAAYALRKRLETLVVTQDLGGKTNLAFYTPWMEGHETLSGLELVNRFKSQLEYLNYAHEIDRVVEVIPVGQNFAVLTEKGKRWEGRAILVATGATPVRLAVPGEQELLGRGLSYSALSHAPLFLDRRVALIGQGPQALRGAAELALVAHHLTLVLMDPQDLQMPLGKQLQANPKVEVLTGQHVERILGEGYVSGIALRRDGKVTELPVEGLFIELGLRPNSQPVEQLVALTVTKRIIVDARGATSRPGIFAAGDVTDTFAEQVLIAIGDGAKAALNAYEYLLERATL